MRLRTLPLCCLLLILEPLTPLYSVNYTHYSCTSTSFGQLNESPIPGGSSIWFTASLMPSGTPTSSAKIAVNSYMITFGQQPNGLPYECHNYPPVNSLNFFNPPGEAEITYSSASNSWTENIPLGLGGATFLTGCAIPPCSAEITSDCIPSSGLPGGLPVAWTINFLITVKTPIVWQWGAAVYSEFPPCKEIGECQGFGPLGIKAVDSSSSSQSCVDSSSNCQTIANSDSNGTPENYKQYLIAGGTSTGPTDYTGSNTATQTTCVLYPYP